MLRYGALMSSEEGSDSALSDGGSRLQAVAAAECPHGRGRPARGEAVVRRIADGQRGSGRRPPVVPRVCQEAQKQAIGRRRRATPATRGPAHSQRERTRRDTRNTSKNHLHTSGRRFGTAANTADLSERSSRNANVVTPLSQLGANAQSRQETVRDGFGWSGYFETRCSTTTFDHCPTGRQMFVR